MNFNDNFDKTQNFFLGQKKIEYGTTTENQKNEESSNSTAIDLGDCETKIKDEYENGYTYYDSINEINYCTSDYSCPKISIN